MVAPRIVVAAHLVAGVAHAHASARWVATGVSDDAVIDRYEGIVLFDLSKRDEAIAAFKEAVSLEPDAPLSALVVLVLNPTWGVRIDGDTLKWWHDGRGEERTVSLTWRRSSRRAAFTSWCRASASRTRRRRGPFNCTSGTRTSSSS
jgi:hypothetical protein